MKLRKEGFNTRGVILASHVDAGPRCDLSVSRGRSPDGHCVFAHNVYIIMTP